MSVHCSFLSAVWWPFLFAVADSPSEDDWKGLSGALTGLYGNVFRLLEVVLVIGAVFALVRAVLKFMSGEKDGAVRLVWWFVGFVAGFAALAAVRSVLVG